MGKGKLNIDSKDPQLVEGEFIDQPSWGEIETTSEILIDKFHLYDSEVKFEGYVPNIGLNQRLKYKTKNGLTLHLVHSGRYLGGRSNATFFRVKEIEVKKEPGVYFRSGLVKNMIYFPDKFHLFGNEVLKREHKYDVNGRPQTEMFFEVELSEKISTKDINKYLLSISLLSCNHLTLMEYCDNSKLTLYDYKSSSSSVPYFGSGLLFFPIKINTVVNLIQNSDWDKTEKLLLSYANYCTTNNWIHQLFRGCSILEYLVDLFWRNLDMSQLKKKLSGPYQSHRRSTKLFGVLIKLNIENAIVEFLESIFQGLNFSEYDIPSKFEFFELRDRHIHRGELFLLESDPEIYRRALASLNDVLRIIIPYSYKIKDWQMHEHPHMKTVNTSDIVDIRQSIMGFEIK